MEPFARYFALWNRLNRADLSAQKSRIRRAILPTIEIVGWIVIPSIVILLIFVIPEGFQVAKQLLACALIILAGYRVSTYFLELKGAFLQNSEEALRRRLSFYHKVQNEFLVAAQKDNLPPDKLFLFLQSEAQAQIIERNEKAKRYSSVILTVITAVTAATIIPVIGSILGKINGNPQMIVIYLFSIAVMLTLLAFGIWFILSTITAWIIKDANYMPSKDLKLFISDIKLISILKSHDKEQSSTADEARLADNTHQSTCSK